MVVAALLTLIAGGCLLAAHHLLRAQWPSRGPHVAVVAWQALGLAWGISTIGALLAFGLAPYGQGILLGLAALAEDAAANGLQLGVLAEGHFAATRVAAIVAAVGLTTVLLWGWRSPSSRSCGPAAAIGHFSPWSPATTRRFPGRGCSTIPQRRPTACRRAEPADRHQRGSPGSTGPPRACRSPRPRARPPAATPRPCPPPVFFAETRLPEDPLMERCYNAVALLIEMCADDHARRYHSPRELATALVRFGAAGKAAIPLGAMAVVPNENQPRCWRGFPGC